MAGRPGRSGRKPGGSSKKVNFNTKIDPDLRAELQAAADAANRTLSNEIELRLRNSLVPAGKVDEATRALCLLIMEAAKQTSDGKRNWTNDANLKFAFTRAVALIISMASAAGRPKIEGSIGDQFVHPVFRSPEEFARAVILRIGGDLIEAKAGPQERAFRALGDPTRWLRHMRDIWQRRAVRPPWDMSADQIRQLLREKGDTPDMDVRAELLQLLAEIEEGEDRS